MTTKPTLKSLKAVIEKIITDVDNANIEAMSGDEALDMVLDIKAQLDAAMITKSANSAENTVQRIAEFIHNDFRLAFASNDEVVESLNAAGITTHTGKPWTKSNISRTMIAVREKLVQMHNPGTNVKSVDPETAAVPAAESVQQSDAPSGVIETTVAPTPALSLVESVSSEEDDLIAELEGLEDL